MASYDDHRPVLLEQVIDSLAIVADGRYLDATFGRGGHSRAILERLNENGRVIAIDRDPAAIAYGKQQFAAEPRLELIHGNFTQVRQMLQQRDLEAGFNGILMDLGVSSPQLDDASRGFSFMHDGPLDMRMDTSRGESAADWLMRAGRDEIARVLREYGEERFARRIAQAIIDERAAQPITGTAQLVSIIERAMPVKEKHKHPATRSFQAIRMHVNQELQAIEQALDYMVQLLEPAGRLAVISFHSIEDRLVKRFMKAKTTRPVLPKGLPVFDSDEDVPYRLVARQVAASEQEISENPRARSARLRVLERLR